MIRFSLKQLSYFVAAAEHGSTLEAARFLNVSQPSVSMAVKHLEDTFEQPVFVRRHAQGISLTPFGKRKLVEARRLIDLAHEMSDPEGERLSGYLQVGLFTTLAPLYAPALLSRFQAAYPDVIVNLQEDTLERLHRDLNTGTIELALLYDLDIAAPIERYPLGEIAPHALLPAGHPLADKPAVSVLDFASHPFVLIDLPGSRETFMSILGEYGVNPVRIVRCNSLEMVRGLVANEVGLSILTTLPASDLSYDGRPLIARPIAEPVPTQNVILASATGMQLTQLARAFVKTSREYFAARTPRRP